MAQRTPYGDRTPEYWRAHAEEARARADEMCDPEGKTVMLHVASLYDDMAVRVEREARYSTILSHSVPRDGKKADGEQ